MLGKSIYERWSIVGALIAIINAELVYKDIDWTSVQSSVSSAIELNVPRGCACEEETITGQKCHIFDCKCQCDLTAGACDPYCCCDTECSTKHITYATENHLCQAGRPEEPHFQTCADTHDLDVSSSKHRLSLNISDTLTCVVTDNSGIKGTYWQEKTYASTQEAFLANSRAYSYVDKVLSNKPLTTSSNQYLLGDVIRAANQNADGDFVHAYGGVLPLPTSSLSLSDCIDVHPASFDQAVSSSRCTRNIQDLATECSTTLASARFVSNVFVAKNPSATSDASKTSDYVQVMLGSVVEVHDDSTVSSSSLRAPFPSYVSTSEYNTAKSSCRGALFRLEYVVSHDGLGTITSVVANVIVGTVVMSSSRPLVSVAQEFSLRFNNTHGGALVRSFAQNNLVDFDKSGNPGYLDDLRLRVAKQVEKKNSDETLASLTAMSELSAGMPYLEPGVCRATSASLDNNNHHHHHDETSRIEFGQDSQTSCTLTFDSLVDFQTYCESTSIPSPLELEGVTHVATFGSSDPLVPGEWIALEKESLVTTPEGVYGLTTGLCANLVTSVSLEFLVTRVGSKSNPQSKVTHARAKYHKSSWHYQLGTAAASQTFLLSASVSFVYVQDDDSDVLSRSKKDDLLYPLSLEAFTSSSSSNQEPRSSNAVVVLSMIVSSVFIISL